MQGLLARGYGTLPFAAFLLLRSRRPPAAARPARGSWAGRLTTAAARGPPTLAINCRAHRGRASQRSPADGAARAASPNSSRRHGDRLSQPAARRRRRRRPAATGRGVARPPTRCTSCCCCTPDTASAGDAAATSSPATAASAGLRLVHRLDDQRADADRSTSGSTTASRSPSIEGLGSTPATAPRWSTAGEFVLGYANEYGQLTERPLLPPSADPRGLLPRDSEGPGLPTSAATAPTSSSGSLRQDVDAFRAFIDKATRDAAGRPDPAQAASSWPRRWSGAGRAVHRWCCRRSATTRAGRRNDFGYHAARPAGPAPARSAHTSGARNPRDSLEPRPGTRGSLAINRRHRLLRRGRGYGSPTLGRAVRSALHLPQRQPGPAVRVRAAHLGQQPGVQRAVRRDRPAGRPTQLQAQRTFTTPRRPVRRRYTGLPQFVHVRGGAYFFLPGIRALRYLASATTARPRARRRPPDMSRSTAHVEQQGTAESPAATTTRRSGGSSTRSPVASIARSGWDRLPKPLGLGVLVGLRDTLRRHNLHDTEPAARRPTGRRCRRRPRST